MKRLSNLFIVVAVCLPLLGGATNVFAQAAGL